MGVGQLSDEGRVPVRRLYPKQASPFHANRNVSGQCIACMLPNSYAGSPGQHAAAALADFVVLDMFADATVNGLSAKDAAARAEGRLRRIYRG